MSELAEQVGRLFPRSGDGRRTRLGVEQELIASDEQGAPVPPGRIGAAFAGSAYASFLAFEPGGQVELSLPPVADATSLGDGLVRAVAALRADCARMGVRLAAAPVDARPLAALPLQLTTPRYLAMQRHFDTVGPAGRRMMRATASTQVCLDWWPGAAGLEQWRLLVLAGPFLAAAFARDVGPRSRLSTWLAVDPDRTAFDDRLLHDDPVAAYSDFAAGAHDFLGAGVAAHLTTLFPPVRPRGSYLEVRFLDVHPEHLVADLAAVLARLLYDDDLRRRTVAGLEAAGPRLGEHWRAAAEGDLSVAEVGRDLVRAAAAPRLVGVA